MKTLKVLSFLLSYPTKEKINSFDECISILENEKWISSQTLKKVKESISHWKNMDILDLQENYVDIFDRTPSLSLHLFEHVHGDSRDRGQALVNLNELYKEKGLFIHENETPDYLPLFLEFLSTLPVDESRDHLNNTVNILHAVRERLNNRKSFYASIFEGISDLSTRKPDKDIIEKALDKDKGYAYSLDKIDEEWEEQFAFDNSNLSQDQDTSCPKMQSVIEKMKIPN